MMNQILENYKNAENPRNFWNEFFLLPNSKDNKIEEELISYLMKQVKENLEMLVCLLPEIGYVFANGQNSIINHDKIDELIKVVKEYGIIPESFLKFFEIVGSVDLRGYFPKWENNKDIPLLDPLLILPVNDILDYTKWHIKRNENIFLDENEKPYLWFSYDELTKDGISGDGGYGIALNTTTSIDGKFVNYGIDLSFIDYLRLCFKWAGFPNLHWFQDELKDDKLFQEIKRIGNMLNKF